MIRNREVWLKLERLDSQENVIETVDARLTGGRIDVNDGQEYQRKCSFDLLEQLNNSWQASRWKAYYGYRPNTAEPIVYYPQGVFIPMNPTEMELEEGYTTNLQGSDKMKLFYDYEIPDPITYPSGTTVRSIIQTVAGWFSETKLKLETDLGTLGADLTFEEGTKAGSMLSTLVSSFTAELFYDVDGFLVGRKIIDPKLRPVKYLLDGEDSVHITSSRTIDEANYYNSVTVVGGTVDTDIFRKQLQDDDAIARAGGRIVHRRFSIDAAVTQTQVDGRATYYLSQGVSLPSQINVTNLVLADVTVGDVIRKDNRSYEVKTATIPLDLGTQSITAKEIL